MYRIYHNPACSKSRACLQLLEQKKQVVEVINYLEKPPTLELLRHFAKCLGLKNMVRENEAIFAQLNLAQADEEQILAAISVHPQLLQRPIVVIDQQVILARPPEKILEFIDG